METNNKIYEFKGQTIQALSDIKEEIKASKEDNERDLKDFRREIAKLRNWIFVLSLVTTVAVIERLPAFFNGVNVGAVSGVTPRLF